MTEQLADRLNLDEMYRTIADTSLEPIMHTNSPQNDLVTNGLKRAAQLFSNKNAEYGDSGDVLANFRRLAAQQGVPMSTAWFFLAGKHIDTISQYVRDVRENHPRSRTQPISERIDDLIVYSALLLAIVAEENR